jgi:flagellar basal body rod protein FlgC
LYSLKNPKLADKIDMNVLGIAQQGLQQAQGQFDRAAQNIAQLGLNTAQSQTPTDSVNLSDQAVSLLSAKNQYQADLGVAHTADELQQSTLSLLG